MIKYVIAALGLKAFSSNDLSRKAYRKIGNVLKKNLYIDTYLQRGNLLVSLCRKYSAIHDENALLEIGTGWMNWYSIFLRLFYDVKITMLDVVDNRQFDALKESFHKISERSKEWAEEDHFSERVKIIDNIHGFDA